jgi:hypothetical protein
MILEEKEGDMSGRNSRFDYDGVDQLRARFLQVVVCAGTLAWAREIARLLRWRVTSR